MGLPTHKFHPVIQNVSLPNNCGNTYNTFCYWATLTDYFCYTPDFSGIKAKVIIGFSSAYYHYPNDSATGLFSHRERQLLTPEVSYFSELDHAALYLSFESFSLQNQHHY